MEETILIVDDDMDTLKLVGTTLEKHNFSILAAKDGEQALELAFEHLPDLIVLDVMMPKMDGYEVTRRLRNDPSTESIPIIMFTAKAQVEDKVEGLEVGADDYLTKPTHPNELIARVKSMLKRSTSMTRTLEMPTEGSSASKSVIGLIAPKGGLGLSSLAINLGVVLKEKTEEDVVVAEMQPGRGDISVYLGYPNSSSFSDLLRKDAANISKADVENSLVSHPSGVNFLLSSRSPLDAELDGKIGQLESILGHLSHISPFTVLDLGASLNMANQALLKRCDRVVIAIESAPHTIERAKSLIEDLVRIDVSRLQIHPILLNRTRTEQALSINAVQKELGYDMSAVFTPAPELAYQSASNQKPMVIVDPNSFTKQQVGKLVEVLV